jgi:S1-C subfamily serine protease
MKTPFTHPRRTAAAAVSAAALLGAAGGAAVVAFVGTGSATEAVRTITVGDSAQPAATASTTVGEIYEQASASVVEISITAGGGTQGSQGSGFVYDDQGHVVTNHHVVDGAETATITLADGSTYDATVVGTDPSTDLAVLDVDAPASALTPLDLADSDALKVGDGVIAIGSPFGLDQTVTSGIVSALHRQITAPNDFSINDAIQTDAAINHGNSGGPLLDFAGDVVGVNSQIESDSGGNVGIGFAVPSNTVETIAAQLIASGEVAHAYLGIGVDTITASLADELDLPEGVQVTNVRAGTPAATAGLKAGSGSRIIDGQAHTTGGDVITEIDGEAVTTAQELQRRIDEQSPGDTIELTVSRGGRELSVDVTLTTRPSE